MHGRYEVVNDVFESLTCARVKPAEKTFALMVDSMISVRDCFQPPSSSCVRQTKDNSPESFQSRLERRQSIPSDLAAILLDGG